MFFPTIIIICHPLLRLEITSVRVGHVGAGQLSIYFGPGLRRIQMPRSSPSGKGVRGFQMTAALLI